MFRFLGLMLLLATIPACTDADPSVVERSQPAASADPSGAATPDTPADEQDDERDDEAITIVYLGDSLTAGYGLAGGDEQAYPTLLQAKADSLGWNVRTVNAGVSGDTSAGGLRRVEWLADRQTIDILVLALGANDGLRGLPTDALRENLDTIIDRTRAAKPDVRIVLAGMMVPTNMGEAYSQRFADVYRDVAEDKNVTLIPFLLDRVGGIPALNQADGVHPTARGQQIMAETVWQTLRPVIDEVREST